MNPGLLAWLLLISCLTTGVLLFFLLHATAEIKRWRSLESRTLGMLRDVEIKNLWLEEEKKRSDQLLISQTYTLQRQTKELQMLKIDLDTAKNAAASWEKRALWLEKQAGKM